MRVFHELPTPLLRYVIAVGVGGPLIALAIFVVSPPTGVDPAWVGLLTVIVAVANRFPLHLTHKTNINVATAAYVAMVLTLPPAIPGLLALTGVTLAQVHRWRTEPARFDPAEAFFNLGQETFYVTIGALVYAAVEGRFVGPALDSSTSLGALVAAALAMHVINTGLVAGASSVQLGISPLRVWWHTLGLDLTPHVTLTLLGTITALLVADRPLLLLLMAAPLLLVQRAVRETLQLRVDTHEALASLIEVVELRDPYTAGHSRRVATTARLLALRLGLTEQEADVIESAARVHDIGKVALDQSLLRKPGKLSEEEWDQMRRHPVHGANVVERFAAYRQGVAFVRHHHEAWNGAGYPDSLAGDAIPLGARIIAVADTFDALTSDRPYRDALAVASAVSILEQGAGKQWDRRVVDALVTTLRETPGAVPVGSTGGGNETAASVAASVATPPATPTASPISASAGRGPDDTR